MLDAERPTTPMRHVGFLPTYLCLESQRHCWDDGFGEYFSYTVPGGMDFERDAVEVRYWVEYYSRLKTIFYYLHGMSSTQIYEKYHSLKKSECAKK